MTKVELEVKIEALQKLLGEKVTEQTNYQNQINELEKQLADLNKPKLTAAQLDAVNEAIETAIGQFDFEDQDNYSIEFGIDYNSRVCVEHFSFDNAYDLTQEIYSAVEELFAEVKDVSVIDADNNQLNQD
jgi:predicted DNA binding protein